MSRLDPNEYSDHCFHQIVAINKELANIETLEGLKAGPYADCADLLDELICGKNQRITDLAEWVAIEVRESIRRSKRLLLEPFLPHGLYAREDIARQGGEIREGYQALNILFARSRELYELGLEDGILLDSVLPALERHKTLIDETNEQLAHQIDRIGR